MEQNKGLEENLDEFQKIVVDLNNIGEKMSDENQTVILLNSLLERYREVNATIKYGRDSLTMNIMLDALKTRNLEIKKEHKDEELLMARGRSDKKSWKGKKKSSRMNSKGEARKYFLCHKDGQFKRHCPLNKSKEASSSKHAGSERMLLMVQIAAHDEMIIMLTNVKYVPELKRNLISLGELDRSCYTIKFKNGVTKVTKGSLIKLRGTLRNGLYVLEGTAVSGKGSNVSSDQSPLVSQTEATEQSEFNGVQS
ncbi:putative retrotransposon [Cucumis melo var. makuwa]|uniref:Retrotransposon n=1 Tax=Cucumis melo var. makuwa TaxID=1194695 RepID=A0A5A7SVM2_CUCMM|nr:putative retrotransposon [Cucumis melo var. makuwa]